VVASDTGADASEGPLPDASRRAPHAVAVYREQSITSTRSISSVSG